MKSIIKELEKFSNSKAYLRIEEDKGVFKKFMFYDKGHNFKIDFIVFSSLEFEIKHYDFIGKTSTTKYKIIYKGVIGNESIIELNKILKKLDEDNKNRI